MKKTKQRKGRVKRRPKSRATRPKALPKEARTGRTAELTIGVSEGKVRIHFDRPIQTIDLETIDALKWPKVWTAAGSVKSSAGT